MEKRLLQINGAQRTSAECARLHELDPTLLAYRLKGRLDLRTAFSQRLAKYKTRLRYKGKLQTTRVLERVAGVLARLISIRVGKGWSVREAVEILVGEFRKQDSVIWEGKRWPLAKLAAHLGMRYHVLYDRVFRYEMELDEAIKRPLRVIKNRGRISP